VTPGDAREVEAAMRRLVDDQGLRAAMGRVARERASELSWERAAAATLAALREAAA
jgi:glycosyltransferase involved in cell wall biosynthesis